GRAALQALDGAGIKRAVLLSAAYIYASPMVKDDVTDLERVTRAENRFVVETAASSHGRFIAFVSVNPLASNAIPELKYWAHAGGARGVKLHLANSFLDFSSSSHIQRLAEFFALASAEKMPIAIHVRNSEKFGASEARRFVTDILPKANGLPIQIAHVAGWGN